MHRDGYARIFIKRLLQKLNHCPEDFCPFYLENKETQMFVQSHPASDNLEYFQAYFLMLTKQSQVPRSRLGRPGAGSNEHSPSYTDAVRLNKHIQSVCYNFSSTFYDAL